jgi:outer membrane immunogenic protein
MKRIAIALLAGVAAVAGLGYSASAAELAVKALPPAPVLPSWTGFYLGVHAGAAFENTPDWTFTNPNTGAMPGVNHGGNAALGAVGGIQGGYNWQFAPAWVLGVEGDFSWASLSDHRTITGRNEATGLLDPRISIAMTESPQWLASVRGKIGFVGWWNTMFYATGGGAWANIEYSGLTTNAITSTIFQANNTFNSIRTGWVAGAGAEWMATPNVLLRVEYLYYGIDTSRDATAVVAPPSAANPLPFTYSWSRENFSVVRIAGSYKF